MNPPVITFNPVLRRPIRHDPCRICKLFWPIQAFSSELMTPTCKHKPVNCCVMCICASVGRKLNAKGPKGITCDYHGCKSLLSRDVVAKWGDDETLEIYDRLCTGAYTLCPSCKKGQVYSAEWKDPKVVCIGCEMVYCYDHRVKWTKFHRCELSDAYAASKRGAFKLLASKVFRRAKKFAKEHLIEYPDATDRVFAK